MSEDILFFEIEEGGWDLSMMKMSYNLTKRTTKIEKFEKTLKVYNIKIFRTVCYKLTATSNIILSIFIYKPMRPVSNLRLPKEQKTSKNSEF